MEKNKDNDKRSTNQEEQSDEIRLNRYLSNAGVCNRREADELIRKGLVKVNGEVVKAFGVKVSKTDKVEYQGFRLIPEQKVYILMNKPKGVAVTTKDANDDRTIFDILDDDCEEHVFPIGRFDKESSGVLMLTNDRDLVSKLTDSVSDVKNIYQVTTDKKLTKEHMKKLKEGFELEDGFVQVAEIDYIAGEDGASVGIELYSGKERIVRRMFAHLGYVVVKLDRAYYAGFTKKNLKRGWFRYLTQEEINRLKMNNFK